MKKTLLSILSISSTIAFGQINITSADLPTIGTNYINIKDIDLQGVNVGASGIDQTYDFSALLNTGQDSVIYLDPAQTIYASMFTNANLAMYTNTDSSFAFFDKTATDLNIVGMLMPVPIGTSGSAIVSASDPLIQMTIPTTYLTSFTDLAALSSTSIPFYQELSADPLTYFDSIRANITYNRMSTVDGWGTILTPFGTSYSVLRQVVTDIRTITPEFNTVMIDTLFGQPVTIPLGYQTIPGTEITDTTVTYYYLANIGNFNPLVLAEVQQNGLGLTLSAKYASLPFAALDEIEENTSVMLFPNPAKNEMTIYAKENIELIEIFSLEGKKLTTYKANAAEMNVSLSNMEVGSYVAKIHTNSGISTKKFIKN